ncbi:MAG: hypothetical protein LAT84_01810 [Balneolia bacterium]|nr:hypothetical protein [Balneolia bacterium]
MAVPMLLLFFIAACDSPPGATPYEEIPAPFSSMSIDPSVVVFDSTQEISDTTLTIQIEAGLKPDAITNNPQFTVSRHGSSTVFREGLLQPGNNNTVVGSFTFTVPSNTFQDFTIYVFDETEGGRVSSTFQTQLQLQGFTTQPPQILSFTFPSVVQIPVEGFQPIRFETEVEHPQGQAQIQTVFLALFDTAGNQLGGEPFTMLDDGDEGGSGDLEEGDGIFTRTLEIGPNNQPDTYEVLTWAIDRQGLSSDTLSSTLTIQQ